jgi:hypothetical protein
MTDTLADGPNLDRIIQITVTICALVTVLTGCYSVQTMADDDAVEQSYLELKVEPATAEIFIDDEYQGIVERWREQVVPIEPGYRRLELRAQGYISQRFDLDVKEDTWLTLRVKLEPTIDVPGGESPSMERDNDSDDYLPAPPHPSAPSGD